MWDSVKYGIFISGLVNILLVIAVTMVTIFLDRHGERAAPGECSQDAGDTEQRHLLDVPPPKNYCFDLGKTACEERGFKSKHKDNRTVCCGNLQVHLRGLLSEALEQTLSSDAKRDRHLRLVKSKILEIKTDGTLVDKRPAAHLGVVPSGSSDPAGDSLALRVSWDRNGTQFFITGDLEHRRDRIVVRKPGYYFIYTGLQFMIDPAKVSSSPIVAYVFRDKNDTNANRKKLMTSRESSCKDGRRGHVGPASIFMAGVFLLHEDDEISVLANTQSMLTRSPANTYFGLHLV